MTTSAQPDIPQWMQDIDQTLEPFQKQVRQFIIDRPFSAIWLGMGSGKSLTTLSALSYARPPGHILVIAPRNIAVGVWAKEVLKWNIPLRTVSLNVTPPGRKTKAGKAAKTRNLTLEEFATLADGALTDPPTLYTVSVDQIPKLVEHYAQMGNRRYTKASALRKGSTLLDSGARRHKILWIDKSDPALVRYLTDKQISEEKLAAARHDPELMPAPTEVDPEQTLVTLVSGSKDYSYWPFPVVILDESQAFKSPTSSRFKILSKVRPHIQRMIQLSGTPSPEEPGELWSQIYLLDQGATWGDSILDFRNRWFTPSRYVNNQVVEWKITDANRKKLYESIEHLALSAENTSLPLPGYLPLLEHRVDLGPELLEHYNQFRKESVLQVVLVALAEKKEFVRAQTLARTGDQDQADAAADAITEKHLDMHAIIAENGGVLHGRLLQFAAGNIYLDIDPSHEGYEEATKLTSRPVAHLHNLKIGKAIEIIQAHRAHGDGPILLAYRFNFEREILMHHLQAAGIKVKAFDGLPETIEAWDNREYEVMILHPASAGHGLNLQFGGSTLIWLSLPDSNEHFRQTPARLNRVGQSRPVRVHAIITGQTRDEDQIPRLEGKEKIQQDLLEHVRIDLTDVLTAGQETEPKT